VYAINALIRISQMHKLPKKSSIIRFRISAALICLKMLLIIATFMVYAWAFATHDRQLAIIGLWLTGAVVLLFVIRQAIAASCKCPLCRVAVLSPNGCSKYTNAKSFIGSHRLRVALQILLTKRFRCPYCNETTKVVSRR
jgi:hypothetical protein